MIVGGQFLAFVINAILGTAFSQYDGIWRWMLLVAIIPALVLFFGMKTVPESPRWLYMNKSKEEALTSLEHIRTNDEAVEELDVIDLSLHREKESTEKSLSLGAALKTPWIRNLIFLGIALGVMQQIMGINVMMYYGTKVLTESGLGANISLIVNTFNGLFSVIAAIVGMNLMHKIDRRKMIITGISVSLASMIAISTTIFTIPNSPLMPFIIMIFIVTFVAFFQGCVGPVTWLLLSEIFPQRVRGLGMGIATFFLWMTNFLVALVFPMLLAGVGIGKTFLVFVALNAISLIFAIKFVPETRGKSLEEIELDFKFEENFE
jgi:major inositol transporter-like SP family MFS transporter